MSVEAELARWGMENATVTAQYCSQLNDLLVRNYPCMVEGRCYQFGMSDFGYFALMSLLMAGFFFLGYYIAKKRKV